MAKKKAVIKDGSDFFDTGHKLRIRRGFKLTRKQQKLLKLLLDDDVKVVFITGPAGTSKTYLAVYAALQKIDRNGELDVLYLRSAVENCVKGLGHLPGSIDEKFSPYMTPLYDKLLEFIDIAQLKDLEKDSRINAEPINYLRGANWIDKFVIVDEAQNITMDELVTLVTRAGEGVKIILCGDLMQSDIRDDGFKKMCDIFSGDKSEKMGIHRFNFETSDIVRSKLVKFIVEQLESV